MWRQNRGPRDEGRAIDQGADHCDLPDAERQANVTR